ncbi:hypothetical protein PGN35_020215 [Nodosilinea sp. PGN35]|nr:hypothetical protein [Nodosilinea sp. TSF1-S3]MDF0365202.1 hypothetical protein [Nodosilinea sp. TSF1-S3]
MFLTFKVFAEAAIASHVRAPSALQQSVSAAKQTLAQQRPTAKIAFST